MKNFKSVLHLLLTFASLLGFLGGWATLAHSRKPIQPTSGANGSTQAIDPLPPLAPLPALGSVSASNNNNGGLFSIAPSPSRNRSRPLLTTSGS